MKINNKFQAVIFLLVGVIFSFYYIFTSDFSFTILPHNHSVKAFKSLPKSELTAGKKITGELVAAENHLGIIAVRVNTFARENSDTISFRIKEKNSKAWYSDMSYRTTFANNEFYNFGFPLIEASKRKTYIIEIQSKNGRVGDGITISRQEPVLVSKYKFPKQELIHSPATLVSFLKEKCFYIMTNGETLFALAIFFLPFFYILLPHTVKKGFLFHILFFALVVYDSLFLKEYHTVVILFIMSLWLGMIRKNKDKPSLSYKLGLALLLLQSIVYVIMGEGKVEKFSMWAFLFITVGTVFSIYRLATKKHDI